MRSTALLALGILFIAPRAEARPHSAKVDPTKIVARCRLGDTSFQVLVKHEGNEMDSDALWIRTGSARLVRLMAGLEVPAQPKPPDGSPCENVTAVDARQSRVILALVVDDRPNWNATLVVLYDLKRGKVLDSRRIATAEHVSIDHSSFQVHQTDRGEGCSERRPYEKGALPGESIECADA